MANYYCLLRPTATYCGRLRHSTAYAGTIWHTIAYCSLLPSSAAPFDVTRPIAACESLLNPTIAYCGLLRPCTAYHYDLLLWRTTAYCSVQIWPTAAYCGLGEFVSKLHDMSKHLVFEGEGFDLVRAVSDAAHGGQLLLTHAVVDELLLASGGLASANNLVLQRLGTFDIDGAPEAESACMLYEARPCWGSAMPWRSFASDLAGATPVRVDGVSCSPTMNIVPLEQVLPTDLAFAGGQPTEISIVIMRSVVPLPDECLPLATDLVMAITQQFGGVAMPLLDSKSCDLNALSEATSPSDVRIQLGEKASRSMSVALLFSSASDACSCACTIQLACDYAPWNANIRKQHTNGPTFAMVVHSSSDVNALEFGELAAPSTWMNPCEEARYTSTGPGSPSSRHTKPGRQSSQNLTSPFGMNHALVGTGTEVAQLLTAMVHGGQVVVTEPAWKRMQLRVPARVSLLSLGRHLIRPDTELDLMQAMPSVGAEKNFPPLATIKQLMPGYFDAPDATRGVAIVFCRMPSGTEQELRQWAAICREAWMASGGYECKEPDPGKFTLAFHFLADAMMFGVRAQKNASAAGLAVCIGSAFGTDLFRKPLAATGRADYFGSTANLAARVMGQAHPGQMVVELTTAPVLYGLSLEHKSATEGGGVWQVKTPGRADLRLTGRGMVCLKGVPDLMLLMQVNAWDEDSSYSFPPPKGWKGNVTCGNDPFKSLKNRGPTRSGTSLSNRM